MLFSISLLWGDTFKHEARFLTLYDPEMGVFGNQKFHTETNRALPDVDKDAEMNGTRGRSMVAEVKTKNTHLFLAHLPLWHIRNPPMPKSMFVLDFFGDHRWK